jgi:replicative DNA helicase
MIFSLEIEQQFLATLLQYPENYVQIADFITHKDFYSEKSKVNSTVFSVTKQILEKGEDIDPSVVIDRVNSLGISFGENLSIFDYIHALGMRKTSEKALTSLAKELKKYAVRREIYESARNVAKEMKEIDPSSSYSEIVNTADVTFNKKINFYESGASTPSNIMSEMADLIEERGNNPIEEFGLEGPYPKTHDIYGSLVRPGNITVAVARSGVGKTTLCMDLATKLAMMHGVPILHFDNGEMSKEELIMRQCSALSGVPMHLLETGKWRQDSAETVERVRSVWAKIKPLQFYYYGVGGMDVDEMITVLKRFYYSTVGRGNKMVFSFDYIKPHRGGSHMMATHEKIGFMMDAFKSAIKEEILHEGEPIIPMVTSVQSNRFGITHNRNSDSVVDDESIVSLSDHITQYCSHMFILRKKTMDELEQEGELFGTHKLICIKPRHLGRDFAGHLEPVLVGDRLRNNFINLDIKGFNIQERGDLRDIVAHQQAHAELETVNDGLPPQRQTENSNGPIQTEIPDFNSL